MPSLKLTPDLVDRVICLPGTALIRCSPPEEKTDGGGLFKPEAAAEWERNNLAVRKGIVVKVDNGEEGSGHALMTHRKVKIRSHMKERSTVFYLGRQDEAEDDYVVVKIGQIVAVLERGE